MAVTATATLGELREWDWQTQDELDALEALVEDVLRRWDAAAAPHLTGAEAVWHRQEVAATRRRLDEALERARMAAAALEAETATAMGRRR